MKPKLLALTAVAAASLTAAGCGGSSNGGLSYSAFSQAANKICHDADTGIKTLNNIHPTSLTQAADPLNKADSYLQTAITQMQGLQGPSALTSARDTYVSDLQQASSDLKSMSNAAKNNDASGFKTGALSFESLKGKAKTDGSKLGAPSCASSS